MKPVEVGEHLVMDPRVCHGQLTFKGTRVPVETILNRLAKGRSVESILESWPYLTRESITEAVRLATATLLERYSPRSANSDEPNRTRRTARRTGSPRRAKEAV